MPGLPVCSYISMPDFISYLKRKLPAFIGKCLGFVIGLIAALIIGIIIISILDPILLKHHHAEAPEPEIELGGHIEDGYRVIPGERIEYSPDITNTGEVNVYAMLIFSCKCYEEGTVEMYDEWDGDYPVPAYVVEPNEGWELKWRDVSDGEMTSYYAYMEVLHPGETTPPLCDDLQYNLFRGSFQNFEKQDFRFTHSITGGASDMISIDDLVDHAVREHAVREHSRRNTE